MLVEYSGYLLAALTVGIVLLCALPLFRRPAPPPVWATLKLSQGGNRPMEHWECALGRSEGSDVVLHHPSVVRTHAVMQYTGSGDWTITPVSSKGDVWVGGERVQTATPIRKGSRLRLGEVSVRFFPAAGRSARTGMADKAAGALLLLGVWQCVAVFQLCCSLRGTERLLAVLGFALLTGAEWSGYAFARQQGYRDFIPETLGFFLTAMGFAVAASSAPETMPKECLLLLAGLGLYYLLRLWLRDLGRVQKLRWLMGAAAIGFLALTLLTSQEIWGARNWLIIAGQSLQPSEFVKIAYIYAGAATLDRLYRRRNLLLFIAFSAVCVCTLALMGDFGTALVFFSAFLVISYVRSGSFATVLLALVAAALAVLLVLTVRPYVAQRFATWGHVWEDPLDTGFQQVRAMSALAAGGLFGRGAGSGWLQNVVAADTDLVFAVICEELGLVTGLGAVLGVLLLAVLTVRDAGRSRSAYYAIAACGAVTIYMVQLALNVFGSLDLLPFTGVTFPFISRGGSSLIACWGMLAFLTAGREPLTAVSGKVPVRGRRTKHTSAGTKKSTGAKSSDGVKRSGGSKKPATGKKARNTGKGGKT